MLQGELAALCDISQQAVPKWKNDTANPDMENLRTLSRSLRVSIDGLLGSKIPLEKEVVKEKGVIYMHSRYTYRKRCRSKLSICGIPLVDISTGKRRTEKGYWQVIGGIIAIGNVSVDVISTGLLSVGLHGLGLLTLRLLFAIGPLALSYFTIDCLAIDYISIDTIAIGIYSTGMISIGPKSAIGAPAYGEIAMGTNPVGDVVYHLRPSGTCFLDLQKYLQFQEYLSRGSLPKIVKFFIQVISLYQNKEVALFIQRGLNFSIDCITVKNGCR